MSDDRPDGEPPPLKLRRRRRLLPELELDVRRRRPHDGEPDDAVEPIGVEKGPAAGDGDADEDAAPVAAVAVPDEGPAAEEFAPIAVTELPATPPTVEPPAMPPPAPAIVAHDDGPVAPPKPGKPPKPQRQPKPAKPPKPGKPPKPPKPPKPGKPAKPPKSAKPAKPPKPAKPAKPPKPGRAPKAQTREDAPELETAAKPDKGSRPRKPPLYWRVLRLRHVHPNGWQRAVLLEGVIGTAVVLVLAGKATLWTLLVLPVVAAVLVKLHDVLVGALRASDTTPAEDSIPPSGAADEVPATTTPKPHKRRHAAGRSARP